jgi:hypothetical protein
MISGASTTNFAKKAGSDDTLRTHPRRGSPDPFSSLTLSKRGMVSQIGRLTKGVATSTLMSITDPGARVLSDAMRFRLPWQAALGLREGGGGGAAWRAGREGAETRAK